MDNNVETLVAEVDFQIYPKRPHVIAQHGRPEFAIISWRTKENATATVKGTYPFPPVGKHKYKLRVQSTVHPKYGPQYNLISIEDTAPAGDKNALNEEEYKDYIFKRVCTDLQQENLLKIYEDPMMYIETCDIEALSKAEGIGQQIAQRICLKYNRIKELGLAFCILDDMGLNGHQKNFVCAKYGTADSAVHQLMEDPYDACYGGGNALSFFRADKIARQVGSDPKGARRLAAYIYGYLRLAGPDGKSWEYRENIISATVRKLGEEIFADNNLSKAVRILKDYGVARTDVDPSNNRDRIFLNQYYDLEQTVAQQLTEHYFKLEHKDLPTNTTYVDWEDQLDSLEDEQGWNFTKEQREGIKTALNSNICLITGAAGTGKSSLVAGLLRVMKNKTFVQTALAGKAAARLQEVTHQEGMTIHRFIANYAFNSDVKQDSPMDEDMPLWLDLIIIDELSLVGGELFKQLMDVIDPRTKIVMLGDEGQLEAIGSMNIAHDIINSDTIPVVRLTQILRQEKESGIIEYSAAVRHHEILPSTVNVPQVTLGNLQDMHIFNAEKDDNVVQMFVEQYTKWFVSDEVQNDPFKIQGITPMRANGLTSAAHLNKLVQDIVNGDNLKWKSSVKVTDKEDSWVMAVNDKVMCIENTYHLLDVNEMDASIFNGWTGTVVDLNHGKEKVWIQFNESNVTIPFSFKDLAAKFMLGYVSTVHKYQGSSSPVIIGLVDYHTPPFMRTSELIYTLVTRAEKHCVLIEQAGSVRDAIMRSAVSQKQTFLVKMLQDQFAEHMEDEKDLGIPMDELEMLMLSDVI